MCDTLFVDFFIADIFELVSHHLSQFDLIALSRTCKSFYQLAIPHLYRSITIDCRFSQFEKEYYKTNTTYIKTKPNFLLLLRSLHKRIEVEVEVEFELLYNERLWNLINQLKVINLPPDFYDFEQVLLKSNNVTFFKNSRLNILDLDCPCSFTLLMQLLNDKYSRDNLNILNFTVDIYAKTEVFDYILLDDKLKFKNLTTLSIGPIKQEINLNKIFKIIDPENYPKLENLKLELKHKTFKLSDFSPCLNNKIKIYNSILNDLDQFENLKSLSLCSVNFNQDLFEEKNNSKQRSNFKWLEKITFLELSDVGIISSNPTLSLLHIFYKNCENCNLKYIKIDIRSNNDDKIPEFFNDIKIKENQIKELDLIIRYNMMHTITLEKLIDNYLTMIIIKQKSSLEKLSIEIKSERNLISLEEQLQKNHLLKLVSNKFDTLKSLRIQVHFDYVLLFKKLIFQNIPYLLNFWIVGSNAVPMHFGQGNMYPGIYDKWWRIIYLPNSLIEDISNHPLQYIKIDECLFLVEREKSEIIQPKDSINKLFDNMTRVTFNNAIV